MPTAITKGSVVRLTIDTETDTYEQAIAAVQTCMCQKPRPSWSGSLSAAVGPAGQP